MLEKNSKIFIAGSSGMVGSALVRRLKSEGYSHLLTPSHQELDCAKQSAVKAFMQAEKPDSVIIAAAKVGGIWANMSYPADFIYTNLMIGCNLIHESHLANVSRLLYLGSSCIYPKQTAQPIPEEALLSGPLEETNEAYALAKIAGVKLCQFYRTQYGRRYISAMPTNLYGPKDNYHPQNSHVIPGLIRRFHEAKCQNAEEVTIWGTGRVYREFLYVDDLASALLHLLQHYDDPLQINVGSDEEVTILQLAEMIAEVVGYKGTIVHDLSKPDGTMRKKTDTNRMSSLGWKPHVSLKIGLPKTYAAFLNDQAVLRCC
jgi:GDP-L-fucose synthase